MKPPQPRRLTIGLLVVYAAYVAMAVFAFMRGPANPWYPGIGLGFVIQTLGLAVMWRGLGNEPRLAWPRGLFLAALIASVLGIVMVGSRVVGESNDGESWVYSLLGESELGWRLVELLEPANLQRICFGLTFLALVRLAVAAGHHFRRNGSAQLSILAIAIAASPLVIPDHGHIALLIQPFFALLFLVLRPSFSYLESQSTLSVAR